MPSRRAILLATGALLGTAWPSKGAAPPSQAPAPESGPWSVQLHLHGSFSRGLGSMASQLWQADDVGVDVVWWSDNDFRISSNRSVSAFSFEDEAEPADRGESWTALGPREAALRKHLRGWRSAERGRQGYEAAGSFTVENGRDGSRNFRIGAEALGALDFIRSSRRFSADGGLHHRPLASEVTVRLAVLPLEHDSDGRAFVEFVLSEQAPARRTPARVRRVHYYLSNEDSEPWLEAATLRIPVPFRPGEWNDLALELTADTVAGFPSGEGWDNGLGGIELGVEARAQATPSAHFDDLKIEQVASGPAAYARQRELMERLGRRWPEVAQYQGVEISHSGHHLNELSVGTELLDYDRLASESGLLDRGDGPLDEDALARFVLGRAVEAAHARGGLISHNHMFGVELGEGAVGPEPEAVLEELAAERLFGADLIEVGYRRKGGRGLAEHLWVWDRLAQRGLFPVGIGASDSHGGPAQRWRWSPNNFVTWVLAPTSGREDLIAGLRAGRAFFGDIARFDGRVDLESGRGFRMGQIVVTDRGSATVLLWAEGARVGDDLRAVEADGVAATWHDPGEEIVVAHELARIPGFVRLELTDGAGGVYAVSNPVHFVREVPAAGIPGVRAALDLAGVRCARLDGFDLRAAGAERDGAARVVRISGRAPDGAVLRLEVEGDDVSVTLEGLSGSWTPPSPDSTGRFHRLDVWGEGTFLVRSVLE